MPELANVKRECFCREYIVDFNGKWAATRAGYSERSAHVTASRLLADPNVSGRVRELVEERKKRMEITADDVLGELRLLALSNIADYTVDGEGHVRPAEGLDPDVLRALSTMKRKQRRYGKPGEEVEETDTEIRLWDKPAALRLAMQHLGMLGPKGTEDDPIFHAHREVTDEDRRRRLEELARLAPSLGSGRAPSSEPGPGAGEEEGGSEGPSRP